ncbi:hypothetical protein LYSBPC_18870 [Lysinibacillus piscis]|uniref:Uncharacterized protein n=1 Tax=Lysinibacillus piscis TaxID=2518931 RepID=A0ABQ5NKF7_9BACI|nr:hypothetical protein LYSBPC_18870 [Lysinibacillus sp. KH24]
MIRLYIMNNAKLTQIDTQFIDVNGDNSIDDYFVF